MHENDQRLTSGFTEVHSLTVVHSESLRITIELVHMASLGAALGGEGTADKLPGRSLSSLVLSRLGYPTGAGAPRLVSAEWRGETEVPRR